MFFYFTQIFSRNIVPQLCNKKRLICPMNTRTVLQKKFWFCENGLAHATRHLAKFPLRNMQYSLYVKKLTRMWLYVFIWTANKNCYSSNCLPCTYVKYQQHESESLGSCLLLFDEKNVLFLNFKLNSLRPSFLQFDLPSHFLIFRNLQCIQFLISMDVCMKSILFLAKCYRFFYNIV